MTHGLSAFIVEKWLETGKIGKSHEVSSNKQNKNKSYKLMLNDFKLSVQQRQSSFNSKLDNKMKNFHNFFLRLRKSSMMHVIDLAIKLNGNQDIMANP